MLESEGTGESATPKRDLHQIFDTNRSGLTASLVNRFEHLMREEDKAKSDIRELGDECKAHEFSPRDIRSMKKIAKLRMQDKRLAAVEELESLQRIGRAAGFDLFDFAAVNEPT